MRRIIINTLLMAFIGIALVKSDVTFIDWQYWLVICSCVGIILNSMIGEA